MVRFRSKFRVHDGTSEIEICGRVPTDMHANSMHRWSHREYPSGHPSRDRTIAGSIVSLRNEPVIDGP